MQEEARSKACSQADEAASFVLGALDGAAKESFEAHLATCPSCSRTVELTRAVVGGLREAPPVRVRRDLAPAILARVRDMPAPSRRLPFFRPACAVAALVLLVAGASRFLPPRRGAMPAPGGGIDSAHSPTRTTSALYAARAWLGRTQGEDGAWHTDQWGGDERFSAALSALALLAILDGEPLPPAQLSTVRRATRFLLSQQNENGVFGPLFGGSPYNQGLATLALLKVYNVLQDETLKLPLERALAAILDDQAPQGGWGYRDQHAAPPSLSISIWQVKALSEAAEQGWGMARPGLRKALQWAAREVHAQGPFSYHQGLDPPTALYGAKVAWSAAGAEGPSVPGERICAGDMDLRSFERADYYHAYFLSEALKCTAEDRAPETIDLLRRALVQRQVSGGEYDGSWPPDDRWGRIGGRVYATAIASLALQ